MESTVPKHIWSGVYASLAEVPLVGRGYGGDVWRERSRKRFLERVEDSRQAKPMHPSYPETLLPVVVGMVRAAGDAGPPLRVLDYGGGAGFGYLATLNCLPPGQGIRFTVKEVPEICRLGDELFADNPDVDFVDTLEPSTYDVVHLGSSIQYEEDWRTTLGELCGMCEGHLVVTDLPAGDNPTYASAQTYYDSTLPCWFFNDEEFRGVVESNGMRTVLRTTCGPSVGGRRDLPQDNFPPDLRVGPSLNYVFRKT